MLALFLDIAHNQRHKTFNALKLQTICMSLHQSYPRILSRQYWFLYLLSLLSIRHLFNIILVAEITEVIRAAEKCNKVHSVWHFDCFLIALLILMLIYAMRKLND